MTETFVTEEKAKEIEVSLYMCFTNEYCFDAQPML
jgi:hypothetical protein